MTAQPSQDPGVSPPQSGHYKAFPALAWPGASRPALSAATNHYYALTLDEVLTAMRCSNDTDRS